MPYRRLPTTDVARLRALKAASERADQLELDDLAFSNRFLHPLRNYRQELETVKFQQTQSWEKVLSQNKLLQQNVDKTRLYLTHFLQVLNMCIARDEIPAKHREFYGLAQDSSKLPKFPSNSLVLEWGKKVIAGESKRIRNGGTPIMNPTIAKVLVWYDRFKEHYHSLTIGQQSYQRASGQLIDIRRKTDLLIQTTWNEIEEHYQNLPEEERRAKCGEYGIVYVFRKNEKKLT